MVHCMCMAPRVLYSQLLWGQATCTPHPQSPRCCCCTPQTRTCTSERPGTMAATLNHLRWCTAMACRRAKHQLVKA